MKKERSDELTAKLNTLGCGPKCKNRVGILQMMQDLEEDDELNEYLGGDMVLNEAVRFVVMMYVLSKYPQEANLHEVEQAVDRFLGEEVQEELPGEIMRALSRFIRPGERVLLFDGRGAFTGVLPPVNPGTHRKDH